MVCVNDIVEAEVVEMGGAPEEAPEAAALVATAGNGSLAVTPQVDAAELVQRLDVIREASQTAMTEDVDFGQIPGTNKPTLLKPGAEKLGVLFQLDIQLENERLFDGDHLTVVSHATVFHAPSGSRLGYGEGVCTTKEKKYAKRKQERTCPDCGMAAVIKGKKEYGGGWLCFFKKGGCGAKFTDNVYLLHYAVHFPAAVCAPSMVRRGVGRVQGIFECYANGREAALRTLLARLDNHAAQL